LAVQRRIHQIGLEWLVFRWDRNHEVRLPNLDA